MNWNELVRKVRWILTLAFFVCYCLGQLLRLQVGQSAVYGHDVVIGVYLLVWGVENWQTFISSLAEGVEHLKAHIVSGLFVAWVLAGLILNASELWQPLLYLGRLVVYGLFTYLLVITTPSGPFSKALKKVPITASLFLAAGLVILYFGWLQLLILPDVRFLGALGWDDHYYRLVSTLLDPAFTGAILVLSFLVSWLVVPGKKVGGLMRLALVLGIWLTFSRASYVAMIIGVGSYFLLQHVRLQKLEMSKLGWLAVLGTLVMSMTVLPKPGGEGVNLLRTSTIEARQSNVVESLKSMNPSQWLIGRGVFVPLPDQKVAEASDLVPDHAKVPDNLLVFLIAGLGVGGTALLLCVVWQGREHIKVLPSWVVASLAAVLAHSMFNNTLFQPFVWLWITWAVWVGLKLRSKVDG